MKNTNPAVCLINLHETSKSKNDILSYVEEQVLRFDGVVIDIIANSAFSCKEAILSIQNIEHKLHKDTVYVITCTAEIENKYISIIRSISEYLQIPLARTSQNFEIIPMDKDCYRNGLAVILQKVIAIVRGYNEKLARTVLDYYIMADYWDLVNQATNKEKQTIPSTKSKEVKQETEAKLPNLHVIVVASSLKEAAALSIDDSLTTASKIVEETSNITCAYPYTPGFYTFSFNFDKLLLDSSENDHFVIINSPEAISGNQDLFSQSMFDYLNNLGRDVVLYKGSNSINKMIMIIKQAVRYVALKQYKNAKVNDIDIQRYREIVARTTTLAELDAISDGVDDEFKQGHAYFLKQKIEETQQTLIKEEKKSLQEDAKIVNTIRTMVNDQSADIKSYFERTSQHRYSKDEIKPVIASSINIVFVHALTKNINIEFEKIDSPEVMKMIQDICPNYLFINVDHSASMLIKHDHLKTNAVNTFNVLIVDDDVACSKQKSKEVNMIIENSLRIKENVSVIDSAGKFVLTKEFFVNFILQAKK